MDIVMPKMGESVSEGTIIKWHKKKGDQVKRDEIIFEISTDKVDTEIPSPESGVLTELKYNEGDTVEVGTVVAVIETNGDSTKPATASESIKQEETEKKSVQEKQEEVKPAKVETQQEVKEAAQSIKENSNHNGEDILDITMPKMGESVMEGTIIKWHKKTGESVKKDEIMFEISTDKVDTEVPSPTDGVVAEILVAEQETVEVGTIVAKISVKGAPQTSVNKNANVAPEVVPEVKGEERKSEKAEINKSVSVADEKVSKEKTEQSKTSKFLSPLVMNIAKKENVSYDELDKINGTGLEGRITKKDILNYIEERKSKPEIKEVKEEKPVEVAVKPVQTIQYEPSYSDNEVEKIPMDNVRQKIMQHMINSRDTSVHVTAMLEVDMTKIYNFIKENKEEYMKQERVKLTYMAFIADAAVKALRAYPLVNSAIEGATIIRKKFINLGIAVAIEPTGLIVPNIKNADEKNIIGMAKAINDVAVRARNKRLSPDDITNGTFTITNYGVFGTTFGTPIINQPEVAILGVGTVVKKPVVVEVDGTDTIAVKPVLDLTLSHDHRLIDGMLGSRFLKFIKDTLENFTKSNI